MDKQERSIKDEELLQSMYAEYDSLINTASRRARWEYNPELPDVSDLLKGNKTFVKVVNSDVMQCVRGLSRMKICVLDFASYHNPGGGFLRGAVAQEECICRETLLYPILNNHRKWYNRHYRESSKLYSNDYLYCRKVPILDSKDDGFQWVDFLVMAAPQNVKEVPDDIYDKILYLRQLHAYLAPVTQNQEVDTLVLGAWGCGVFKNDPEKVAENWKDITNKYSGLYRRVFHPILDEKTYKIFEGVYAK